VKEKVKRFGAWHEKALPLAAAMNASSTLDFLDTIPNYHDMNTAIKIFGDFLFRVSPIAGA
jgi:hypothetical protein